MIFVTACNTCLQTFELMLVPDDVRLMKELIDENKTIQCPRLCGGRILMTPSKELSKLAADSRLRDPVYLSGQELYKALMGAGMPDEVPSSPEAVEAMLLAHKVVGVKLSHEGKHVFIDELKLDNKTIIHLASGHLGAVVLKITRADHG